MERRTEDPPPDDNKLKETQAKVDEVVDIMRVNVEKVIQREENLKKMNSIAEDLIEGGKQFEQQAHKLKKKYWWKNIKMLIILAIVVLLILIIIIVSLTVNFGDSGKDENNGTKMIKANVTQSPLT